MPQQDQRVRIDTACFKMLTKPRAPFHSSTRRSACIGSSAQPVHTSASLSERRPCGSAGYPRGISFKGPPCHTDHHGQPPRQHGIVASPMAWRCMGAMMFICNGATMQELMCRGHWRCVTVILLSCGDMWESDGSDEPNPHPAVVSVLQILLSTPPPPPQVQSKCPRAAADKAATGGTQQAVRILKV